MVIARLDYDGNIIYAEVKDDGFYLGNERLDNAKCRELCPVQPGKVVALGLNYKEHISELYFESPDNPVFFIKPSTSVIGDGEDIVITVDSRVDYEAELAFVIGEDCKNVKAGDAHRFILGYTCLNDVTAREIQRADGQWTRAKSYDTFCPIGKYIVTDIEPSNLRITARVNGVVRQEGNTKDMIFPVPEILAFVSSVMTLRKGDVISTGTPSGIGEIKPGDIVEIEIENIGKLTNRVIKN